MTLVSRHATGELSSPFYIKNKEKCEEYESFIEELGGSVEGYYNAWSFNVMGIIDRGSKWSLRLKKSTYTSSGNLLLTSKYQSLSEISQWSSDNFKISGPKFLIRRRSWIDFFRLPFYLNLNQLPGFKNYIIKSSETNNLALSELMEILKEVFKEGLVFTISYESPKLFIDLRTDKIHFMEIEELVKL